MVRQLPGVSTASVSYRPATRIDEFTERRAHFLDLLRNLWLELKKFGASGAQGPQEAKQMTDRIRALRRDLDWHARVVGDSPEQIDSGATGELPTR